jgi:DNA invertase Pin-like site-specific DNA recombinase
MTTVAVYMQVDRFFPPEVIQRAGIQKWLMQNKIVPSSVHWFVDRESKSEFQQMSEDIQNGSIQTLVLYSLEQAFTSIATITDAIAVLASKDIAIVVISQDIFFDSESIKSAHSLLNVVLNLADHYKRMRQRQGIEQAQAKGLYKGKKPGATKPGFDPKKIARWRLRGWSAKRIADKLGVCESTVWRYIRIQREK